MPHVDTYHIIALVAGVVLKLLWERFVGPVPVPSPTPAPLAQVQPGPAPYHAPAIAPVSLPGLLDNPAALVLLRELLHATPPRPPAGSGGQP